MAKNKIISRTQDKTKLVIVKRRGHTEIYDERKVYASCYFACRNAHLSEEESEQISAKVSAKVTSLMEKKDRIYSNEIFKLLVDELRKENDDAAFLLETHRDIS